MERTWLIEWEIPDSTTLNDLRTIVESVRGYGSPHVITDRDNVPKTVKATFTTDETYSEFSLCDDLRETGLSIGWYGTGPGAFPTHPIETRGQVTL